MENQLNPQESEPTVILNNAMKKSFFEMAKWAQILSIIGFIGIGLLIYLIIILFSGFSRFSNSMGGGIPTILIFSFYLIVALIYLFPTYRLFQFSKYMKEGLLESDEEAITLAIERLKSVFKFIGVVTLLFILVYVLIILFAAVLTSL